MTDGSMEESYFGPEAWNPLALALRAYQEGNTDATLLIHSDLGATEVVPVAFFFRGREGLRGVDEVALQASRGRTLDLGAGAGCMALLLQEEGVAVTALEVIPEAVRIMRSRGVRRVVEGRLDQLPDLAVFDTILLLMNGTGLAGTLRRLPVLLGQLRSRLAPGGRVLVDSTDLRRPSDDDTPSTPGLPAAPTPPVPEVGGYFGELQLQLEFQGTRGAPFPYLFVDPATLFQVAEAQGWNGRLLHQGREGEYLASLSPPGPP